MAWRCPKCKSTNLEVVVKTWATLVQEDKDDNFETDTDTAHDHEHEWDSESLMECRDCGFYEESRQFKYERKKRRIKKP